MKNKVVIFFLFISLTIQSCKSITNSLPSEKNYNKLSNISFALDDPIESTQDDCFTFAVIPDSQCYVDFRLRQNAFYNYYINQPDMYFRQMQFIADNSVLNGGDLSFALHVGDLVDHRGWQEKEWKDAQKGFLILNNTIPFLTCIGNHDYDVWLGKEQSHGTSLYEQYFGAYSKLYRDKTWYLGDNNTACSAAIFNTGNHKILVLSMELDASDKDLKWAQKIIDKYRGIPTIYLTHSYISPEKDSNNQCRFMDNDRRKNQPSNSASAIWEKFISENDQIFLVLCGHVCPNGNRTDINKSGNTTYSIISNFQDRTDFMKFYGFEGNTVGGCGDGWLRLIKINLDKKYISIKTYSTEFKCYSTDSSDDYILPITWNWKERFYND